MKHIFSLLFLTIITWVGPTAIHSEKVTDTSSKSTVLQRIYTPGHGKRIPPATFIYCEVVNEMVFFDPNFDYDCMNVEVTGPEISGIIQRKFTVYEPYVIIPLLTGECTIRCITDAGAVYEGSINL